MSIRISSRAGIFAQLGLVVATLGFVSVAPPERGAFLLIPLTENGARAVARLAVDHEARLLAQGPLGGSLIVEGERARLLRPMLRDGVLTIAAAEFLCGARSDG